MIASAFLVLLPECCMNKIDLLKAKTKAFKLLLQANIHDEDVGLWLHTLNPLFDDIADGRVVPPRQFEFSLCLGKEHPFYEPGSVYLRAYSEFISALEDWASQPWFEELKKDA